MDGVQTAGQDLIKALLKQAIGSSLNQIKQIQAKYTRDALVSVLGSDTDLVSFETATSNILNIINSKK